MKKKLNLEKCVLCVTWETRPEQLNCQSYLFEVKRCQDCTVDPHRLKLKRWQDYTEGPLRLKLKRCQDCTEDPLRLKLKRCQGCTVDPHRWKLKSVKILLKVLIVRTWKVSRLYWRSSSLKIEKCQDFT